jgi:hypothetical protein
MSTTPSNHIPSTPQTNNPYIKSTIKTRNKMSFDHNITEDEAMNLAIEANKKKIFFDNHHKGWGDESDSEDEKKSPPKPSEINRYRHVNDTLNYDSDAPKIYLPTKQKMLEKVKLNQKQPPPTNDDTIVDDWNIVGIKNLERDKRLSFQEHSNLFAPICLPLFESEIFTDSPTTNIIPISLHIKTPKNGKIGFKNSRVLVAMIKIFQLTHQDTYIAPIDKKSTHPRLAHYSQVPMDTERLKQYMLDPVLGPGNIYSTKIIIHSNHNLRSFLINPKFRDYISTEGIVVENNNLQTATPTNIGFLEHVVPNHDSVHLHTARLQIMLPTIMPEFQVTLVKTHISDRRYIYLVMIQSHPMHVDLLARHFRDLSDKDYINFFPWSSYVTMKPGKKYTLLQELKQWSSMFRSILVEGFKNNHDKTNMQEIDEEQMLENDNPNPLQNTTVSDYLRNEVKSVTNNELFEYVYPTILGTREFLVTVENYGDAKEYTNLIFTELSRNMTTKSINLEFQNPNPDIITHYQPWKPFFKANNIIKSHDSPIHQKFNNRTRIYRENDHYTTNHNDNNITPKKLP